MKNPRDIIKWPLVTEKSYSLAGQNKYTFAVDPAANKIEIKKAVEELFKVKVLKINTINVKGKPVRVRNIPGHKPDRKKAIVTLKEGDKIEIFS
ncbi:MAG: 50S ribosomal protein L23 [Eubacteriales bacterium]|jgi:large subunit ribosomal protein L23